MKKTMKKSTKESTEIISSFQPKLANRFIVRHPMIPSYLIQGVQMGFGEIKLTCYCTVDRPIKDFFNMTPVKSIKVEWLDPEGKICDSIEYTKCQLIDIEVSNAWSENSPLRVVLTYDTNMQPK